MIVSNIFYGYTTLVQSKISLLFSITYFQVKLLLKALDPSPATAHAVDLKGQEQCSVHISTGVHECRKSPVGKVLYYFIQVFRLSWQFVVKYVS
jgi:hypothetical protein